MKKGVEPMHIYRVECAGIVTVHANNEAEAEDFARKIVTVDNIKYFAAIEDDEEE